MYSADRFSLNDLDGLHRAVLITSPALQAVILIDLIRRAFPDRLLRTSGSAGSAFDTAIGWMRLSMIGSVMFESVAAGLGTSATGVTLGSDAMTDEALAMALWTMIERLGVAFIADIRNADQRAAIVEVPVGIMILSPPRTVFISGSSRRQTPPLQL